MIARTPGTSGFCGALLLRMRVPCAVGAARRARARAALRAVSTAVTDSTPGSASTACSAALRSGSSLGRARAVDLDGEGDMASRTCTPRDHAEADDVLPALGIARPRCSAASTSLSRDRSCRLSSVLPTLRALHQLI